MKNFKSRWLSLRLRLARLIAPQPKKLFIVLKFGGKRFLAMTEDQLRFELAKEKAKGQGAVAVRFQEKSLVFEISEHDPNEKR